MNNGVKDMSADNGIYIGVFPTEGGEVEYRVIHAQAIDNVDFGSTQEQDAYRASYFGGPNVFATKDKTAALLEASRKADEITSDDFCGILEYGIQTLPFDRPLVSMTQEEIKTVLGY